MNKVLENYYNSLDENLIDYGIAMDILSDMANELESQCLKERKAFAWDTMWEEHQPNDVDEDTQHDYDLREKMETYLGSCTHE